MTLASIEGRRTGVKRIYPGRNGIELTQLELIMTYLGILVSLSSPIVTLPSIEGRRIGVKRIYPGRNGIELPLLEPLLTYLGILASLSSPIVTLPPEILPGGTPVLRSFSIYIDQSVTIFPHNKT